jgi:hypothetical protein
MRSRLAFRDRVPASAIRISASLLNSMNEILPTAPDTWDASSWNVVPIIGGSRVWKAGEMTDDVRLARRYKLQVIFAAASVILTIVTAILPMWIELLTGLELDRGSGELEWLFALVPGAISIIFGVLAYRTRRLLANLRAEEP